MRETSNEQPGLLALRRSISQLKKYYSFYTGGFIAFVLALAVAEQMGMSRQWIGYWFLFATIGLYAGIGIMSRTAEVAEYYVAGRRVPAFFNGMATGADWMSAASFIGMAGTLFLAGYRRPRLGHGLDRRLLPGGAVPRALPAQVRPVHHSRLPRRALRRQHRAHHRHHLRDHLLVRLRRGADLRRRPDHQPVHRPGVRRRRVRRPRRHPGVLDAGRHEGGDLDAGGAVHHPHHRLHDAGGLAGHRSTPAFRFRRSPTATRCRRWASWRRRSPRIRRSRRSARSSPTGRRQARPRSPRRTRRTPKARPRSRRPSPTPKSANAPADQIAAAEKAVAAYPKDVAAAKAAWTRETGLAARAAPPRPHAAGIPGQG